MEKGSFIRINYVEMVTITGRVANTNIEAEARKAGMFNSEEPASYNPIPLIIGSGRPTRGVDEELQEMEDGETRDFEVPPEKAYGTRDPKMIDHVPLSFFKRQGINPVRGLPIRTRRGIAIVRNAIGGRIRLDYNHPLAGQTMSYHVEVVARAEDPETKLRWLIEMRLPQVDSESHIIELKDEVVNIELNTGDLRPEIVERLKEVLIDEVREHLPEIPGVNFGPVDETPEAEGDGPDLETDDENSEEPGDVGTR